MEVLAVNLDAFRCPTCSSKVELVTVEGVAVVTVSHDDWCPTLARLEGRDVRKL